jgi:hypothetical protein
MARNALQTGSPPMLQGDRYRSTHQSSVDAVLGANVRKVHSRGGAFYNRDFWPLRTFVVQFCALISRIKRQPTKAEIAQCVNEANAKTVYDPHIVIASTPEKLPLSVALALIGGAYHEAWHTYYSRRTPINVSEVWPIINTVWAKIDEPKQWSRMSKAILDWSNVVEDIRIERCGIKDFPGAEAKMHDLQHFILDQEADGRTDASHRGIPEAAMNSPYSIITAVFRDVGLGYNTSRQRRALDAYKDRNPDAVKFVLDGPLSALLRDAISLDAADDVGCLRIAMEVLAAIYEESKNKPQDSDDKSDDKGEGEGQSPQACPNCGAPKDKLKVQPKSDGKGGKVKGKGVMTCSECGYEEEVDLSDSGSGKGGDSDGIEFDSTPHDGDGEGGESDEDSDDDGDGKGGKGDEDGDADGDSDGEGSDGEGSDGDADGKGEGKGSSDGSDDGDSDGEGDAKDGKDGKAGKAGKDGDDADERADASTPAKDGKGPTKDGNTPSKGDSSVGNGAGGHQGDDGKAKAWEVANDLIGDIESGKETGLKDNNNALGNAFGGEADKADNRCKMQENPYRPWDRSDDSVDYVTSSNAGKANDGIRAQSILNSVKAQCSYLRARLRNIVRAAEQTTIQHGVRRGKDLSERRFVDSKVAMLAGRYPTRAYYDEDEQIDTSLSAVVVMDESSSMAGERLQTATKAFMAITEPLDALGCATMAIGFRDGTGGYRHRADTSDPGYDGRNYHRYHAVHIDVFKGFHEKFASVKWRFANTRAVGGTPMSDGVQFALEALSQRPEAHRVVFIVTDGSPNGGHAEVIAHQTRIAKESGIQVIGVGIGRGASYVQHSFPDHVYAETLSDLPRMLIGKLNEIMDFRGSRRGRTLKATG